MRKNERNGPGIAAVETPADRAASSEDDSPGVAHLPASAQKVLTGKTRVRTTERSLPAFTSFLRGPRFEVKATIQMLRKKIWTATKSVPDYPKNLPLVSFHFDHEICEFMRAIEHHLMRRFRRDA